MTVDTSFEWLHAVVYIIIPHLGLISLASSIFVGGGGCVHSESGKAAMVHLQVPLYPIACLYSNNPSEVGSIPGILDNSLPGQ